MKNTKQKKKQSKRSGNMISEKTRTAFPEGAAVITGASAGLGMEFARQLAAKGIPLILAARRKDRLEQLQKELKQKNPGLSVELYPVDLTQKEEVDSFGKWLKTKKIGIVINNAGCGQVGNFTEISPEIAENMDALNVLAFHRITRIALSIFKEQGEGWLLNVASSAGLIPAGPYMTQYYATKAYAASLTRGIAAELHAQKSPVYVGCLCPGPVNTEFNERAGVAAPLKGISPKACVQYTLRQMEKKQTVIIPAFYMRLALWGGRFLPQNLYIGMTGNQQRKKMRQK